MLLRNVLHLVPQQGQPRPADKLPGTTALSRGTCHQQVRVCVVSPSFPRHRRGHGGDAPSLPGCSCFSSTGRRSGPPWACLQDSRSPASGSCAGWASSQTRARPLSPDPTGCPREPQHNPTRPPPNPCPHGGGEPLRVLGRRHGRKSPASSPNRSPHLRKVLETPVQRALALPPSHTGTLSLPTRTLGQDRSGSGAVLPAGCLHRQDANSTLPLAWDNQKCIPTLARFPRETPAR